MKAREFIAVVKLGMIVHTHGAWDHPRSGRIVAMPAEKYGVWFLDSHNKVHYTDCVWVTSLKPENTGPRLGFTMEMLADLCRAREKLVYNR